MAELPSGTVTFLFTDLEVSTRLWDEEPDAMRGALARHDELLREVIEGRDGHVVKGRGDGVHAVFATADDAVVAAIEAQRAIGAEPWAVSEPLHVRIGIHTGVAELRDGDYFGSSVNRAARLQAVAHGGQIVCSAATADLAREMLSEGVTLADLGEHRLRDLTRPERVFQVHAPGLQAEFAPLSSVDSSSTNLPLQVNSFVGRERDLERVVTALDASRVVTLTGVGGVGKTRLAVHAAAELLPRFRDGAWLCELGAVRDIDGVVPAAASVFRVTERPGLDLAESLVAFLKEQQLLLVLDNCEHLLDGAAALADELDRSCPGVTVLATSREPLAIDGERVLGVRSLATPDTDASVDEVLRADAVRLFVERAQSVKDDFVLDDANAPAVAQICDRLDGVPLAIELAAARVTTMNPAEVARRLDRRFDLLAGGRRKAIERHQTLRAAVDWSYDLLDAREQRLLARLSVFVGGCTLEGAEAVCAGNPIDPDDVYELLASLVARSLVQVDDSGAETRYRLLETIRQYGEERVGEAGEVETTRRRHAEYFEDVMTHVERDGRGPQQIELAGRFARERDNVHAAMGFALDTEDLDLAFRLLLAVPDPSIQVDDLVRLDPEPVLALPGADQDARSAPALMVAAHLAGQRGDGPLARDLLERALSEETRLGPIPGVALDVSALAVHFNVAWLAGDGEATVAHALEGARRSRELARPDAFVANFLSVAASTLAWVDPVSALDVADEALALARRSGMPGAISLALATQSLALAPSDPERARSALDESLRSGTELGYENLDVLNFGTFAAARLGAWPAALRFLTRALQHQLRSGAYGTSIIAGMLNIAAYGLASSEPDPAAIVQGAVTTLVQQLVVGDSGSPEPAPSAVQLFAFVGGLRHETTGMLIERLGRDRLRELRAEGERMTEDHACAYARREIDAYLRTVDSNA